MEKVKIFQGRFYAQRYFKESIPMEKWTVIRLTCIKSCFTHSEAFFSLVISLSCRVQQHVPFSMHPHLFWILNMESRDEGTQSDNSISISSRLTHSWRVLLLFWHLESWFPGFIHPLWRWNWPAWIFVGVFCPLNGSCSYLVRKWDSI